MRAEFSQWLEKEAQQNPKLTFFTSDLGFSAFEKLAALMGPRFINVGVCEQNMVSVAAGMAHDGWEVICYGIAPFSAFRPAEQIRLDVCLHNLNVKIVGNGGGYGYGIMGATHHAIEDIGVLSTFNRMKCLIPRSNEDVTGVCDEMMKYKGPCYLRLNSGSEEGLLDVQPYTSGRQWKNSEEICEVVVFAMGPMSLHALQAFKDSKIKIKMFSVCEIPLQELTSEMVKAIQESKIVWVIEEHVSRGGLGEHICWLAAQAGVAMPRFEHTYALGYPSGTYGSQKFHQNESGLSVDLLQSTLMKFN